MVIDRRPPRCEAHLQMSVSGLGPFQIANVFELTESKRGMLSGKGGIGTRKNDIYKRPVAGQGQTISNMLENGIQEQRSFPLNQEFLQR